MSAGCGPATHFTTTPDHRYPEQVAFLRGFPAYTTESAGDCVVLWYRLGDTPRRLVLRTLTGGVAVHGDVSVARRVLNVDAPALPPEDTLPNAPAAHRILYRRYAGIRPVLFADPFEGIAWTILGQQISVAAAGRLKGNLAASYGRQVDGMCGPVTTFPLPGDLARASQGELRALHLSRQKAAALLAVARRIAAGEWDPTGLAAQPTDSALVELQRFPGIGRWSAEYILLRVVGQPDVLPAGDVALQRAWARRTGATGHVGESDLRRAGEAWSGRRSDFAFALWLDNLAARARPTAASAR